jgi:hypothetical protein
MLNRPIRFALGTACAGLTALLAVAPTAGASALKPTQNTALAPMTANSSPILLYAQDWNGSANGRSTAQWQQVAQTHALLVGGTGASYGNMIPQLHAWNPSLKVLVYDLGPYTIKGSAEFNTLTATHPSYFAHDALGHLITMKAASGSPAFPNNYLMDDGNAGWQAWEAARVLGNINQYGFDGAYLDSMAPGPTSGGDTGLPIDPTTGHAYTATSWMAAEGRAMSVIKAAIGSKFLFSTGLVNGSEFTEYTHSLTDSTANGAQTDSWLRLSGSSPASYPSAGALASDLAMVQSINAKGKSFFGWTKVWTSATAAQYSAWNTYALAAYLLVDNGTTDYYSYSEPNLNADRTTVYYANELAALGSPTGGFSLSNGVYTRSFQNGTVTLNTNNNAASIVWAVKPSVASVTPAAGPVTGGQTVTVTGSGFGAGMTVTMDGTAVTPSNVSFGSFTFTTPADAAGYVQVQVTTSLGSSTLSSGDGYVYAPLGNFVPVTPFRILDTRPGSTEQRGSGALGAGTVRSLQITGVTGLPSGTDPIPTNATAVVLNVTAVMGNANSLFTVYPAGTGRPNASNLNFTAGTVTPNLVTAVIGEGGAVDIYNSVGTVNVLADVAGYFSPAAASTVSGEFHPIAPGRVCDTRMASYACASRGDFAGGTPRLVNVTGAGANAIPATGAVSAAVLNLTGVNATTATFLSVYPPTASGACGSPQVSNLNIAAGRVQANRVEVALGPATSGGPDTSVCVYNSVGTINVVLDANGWFGSGSAAAGDQYQPIGPSRVCDTRAGSGQPCAGHPVPTHAPEVVQVANVGGLPAMGAGSPPLAVVANLTAIAPGTGTYVTLYAADLGTTPGVSDINVNPMQTIANLAVVELSSAGGAVDLYSAASAINVVLDIEGWFQ